MPSLLGVRRKIEFSCSWLAVADDSYDPVAEDQRLEGVAELLRAAEGLAEARP